jgi:hypothetical protein
VNQVNYFKVKISEENLYRDDWAHGIINSSYWRQFFYTKTIVFSGALSTFKVKISSRNFCGFSKVETVPEYYLHVA